MKRVFAALGLVLLVVSSALAVESPHTNPLSCLGTGGCHTVVPNGSGGYIPDLTDAVGVNILCLRCHNPKLQNRAFSPKDIANPFGSTNTGSAAAEQMQTSHNWAAPVNVPAAGATLSQDPLVQALHATQQGVISCTSCHNQHTFTGNNLLRKDMDQLCFDCHGARNQRKANSGTHPVNFTYTSAGSQVKLKPGAFQNPPVNANPANPTAAMRLAGGRLTCNTCHRVHFSDSNAGTFDNASSATFGLLSSSQGYLLRTDLRGGAANAVNICTNCHAGKLAHNNKGQNIQCADCHGAHVDAGDGTLPNVSLLRRYMNPANNSGKVLNQYTGARSNFAGPYGVCVACHAIPAPGGSYPAEHASTDPNICRGCHVHNATKGSFSASCSGCHGFPPQQNVAGGPLGYARNATNSYAGSAAFKDESLTPHLAHAGKAPYSFSCYVCHGGNTHASGNFQQVFIAKTGLAATGGAVPSYSPAGAGSCLTTYCHSNGAPAGGATVYRTPSWALGKNSIIGSAGECGSCHAAAPATNAHPGHLINGLGCALCHAATVASNSSVKDVSKHVNGLKDIAFSGQAALGGAGAYDGASLRCSNLYCHSNGNQYALVYANPASWNSGVNYGCNACHGTSSPVAAPDYANGGAASATANSHGAHTFGETSTLVCANCHFATASASASNTLVTNGKHLSGAADVVFNPAVAGTSAGFDPATGNCSNIACHGGAPATWGSTAGCLGCHSVAVRGRAAIVPQFGANSHHIQGTLTAAHCFQCHWEANSDGTINHTYHHSSIKGGPVELVIYGAGARPGTYQAGVTAIAYTANGTRSEMAKINSHCLGCHSDQNLSTQPFGDGKSPSSYAWDKSSIAAKYGDTATTPWGKYSGGKTTPKSAVTKALSAHGNAANNKGGWNTSETWPDTRGTIQVLCFDCHNAHGSNIAGPTTSYVSATTNGGILKTTSAGVGGYATSYAPVAGGSAATRNLYNPGAALCFDCHLTAAAGATPWGYNSTFGATQPILGYWDAAYFGAGSSGNQQRYPYKAVPGNMGGHFGASSPLSASAAHQIGGLCTPCHDPHGVSPTLGANKVYGVPLLKGTWVTSPYKEDAATADNKAYNGSRDSNGPSSGYGAAVNSYHIDQNTFASGAITQSDVQFAGLCLGCHAKAKLTNGITHTWKSKDRIHEAVKGWKTANSTIKHGYSCSKCHTVHNANLPRLMVTNCLDSQHRGRVANQTKPVIGSSGSGSGRNRDSGSGHQPGIYDGGGGGSRGGRNDGWGGGDSGSMQDTSVTKCHEGNDANQKWNAKTPWPLTNPPKPATSSTSGSSYSSSSRSSGWR